MTDAEPARVVMERLLAEHPGDALIAELAGFVAPARPAAGPRAAEKGGRRRRLPPSGPPSSAPPPSASRPPASDPAGSGVGERRGVPQKGRPAWP